MKTVFVGGTEFDKHEVRKLLKELPAGAMVVTGDGQGLEVWVQEVAKEMGLTLLVPPLHPEWFNYKEHYLSTKAVGKGKEGPAQQVEKTREVNMSRHMQVNDLFIEALHNRLVLVGKGQRVTAAENILKMSNAWPVEVVRL